MRPADLEVAPSPIAGHGAFARTGLREGTPVGGPLNHSCDPTSWYRADTLVTRRDVAAGEELTYDYATGITEPDFVMMCHCGSYRCRQLIAGDDWRIPQLQVRYAGHWTREVQRLIDADASGLVL